MSLKPIRSDDGVPSENSVYEDDRYAGSTVSKARQKQKSNLVLNSMIRQARQKKAMGFSLSPEEEFVLNNMNLINNL